jgi:hypothetical protein
VRARRPDVTIAMMRDNARQSVDHPKLWEQMNAIIEPGMRKAGFPER